MRFGREEVITAKKDLKKRVRDRQAKTGASYTTARSHILRARDSDGPKQARSGERITAIVLKCSRHSMRVRFSGEEVTTTLRASGYDAWRTAPGQLVDATLNKRWTWRGDAYASGSILRAWTDVPSLGLDPLPLEDRGVYHLEEIHEAFRRPDPYAEMWEFFASTPRRSFEFDGIAWGAGVGVDPKDPEACLIVEAAEIGANDPVAARDLLMSALLADLRCIDAHVHLGNLVFEHAPEKAITHYDIAVGIGDLSLGPDFDGMLPWGCIYNRPLLRALHGYGLCLWRLDRTEEARRVFERALALNPPDHQGVRFCWNDIRNRRPWTADGISQETSGGKG